MTQQKSDDFGFGTQIRKSPFFDATVRWGATGFSVYNHMYIPRDFGNPEQNFWNLIQTAILCDVAVERQVEITGPDAAKFVQFLTPRDLSAMAVGQCKYVILTNQHGGILNDPVLLRLGANHFWLSLADSDVLFWAQGVALNAGYDVTISEPDVSPLQLQGPQSGKIMQSLFGSEIADLKYYWCRPLQLDGIDLLVSRTGWSSELGYELFCATPKMGIAYTKPSCRPVNHLICTRDTRQQSAVSKVACYPTMRIWTSTPTRLNLVLIALLIWIWKMILLAKMHFTRSKQLV